MQTLTGSQRAVEEYASLELQITHLLPQLEEGRKTFTGLVRGKLSAERNSEFTRIGTIQTLKESQGLKEEYDLLKLRIQHLIPWTEECSEKFACLVEETLTGT